jgi:hypothetical protein
LALRTRPDLARRELVGAVTDRRAEIVEAVLARAHSIGGSDLNLDPEYLEGLRLTVGVAIDHGIDALGHRGDGFRPVPLQIPVQAALAARSRVPLETVLRRYLAGHSVLGDFVAEEAERKSLPPSVLRGALRSQAAEADRILAVVSAAYEHEVEASSLSSSSGGRLIADKVRRLLDGELLDPSDLGYDLDLWHIGLTATGRGIEAAVGDLASASGALPLSVVNDKGILWAWLGHRSKPDPGAVVSSLTVRLPGGAKVGVGEPGQGRPGWRLTHNQATAALSVAARATDPIARYADSALLASVITDELLVSSLRSLYLDPLDGSDVNGEVLRKTLLAYFSAEGNVTSTAAALGVNRNTVTNRLRAVEARIGHLRPFRVRDAALALQLRDLRIPERPIADPAA